MRFRTGFLALAVCAAVSVSAEAATEQTVKISAPSNTVATYDTLTNVTATVRTPAGSLAPSVSVMWTANPLGLVKVVPTVRSNQSVKLVGLGRGTVHLTATYYTSSAKAIRDTMILNVQEPKVISVALYWGFTKDSLGNTLGYQNLTLPVGSSHCLYTIAVDKIGNPITGKTVTLTSTDTTIARIDRADGTPCPDTTVNPRFVVTAPEFTKVLQRSASSSIVLRNRRAHLP